MTSFNLMILAAGYGKRMKNLTDSKPKPLLKINNKELLRHNIDFFLTIGCKKIVINTHYLHDQIQTFIKEYYSDKNIQLTYEPIEESIRVFINGALNYDWYYSATDNTIYFTVIPGGNDLVEVGYRYFPDEGGDTGDTGLDTAA